MQRPLRRVAIGLLVPLTLAACGGDDTADDTATEAADPGDDATATGEASTAVEGSDATSPATSAAPASDPTVPSATTAPPPTEPPIAGDELVACMQGTWVAGAPEFQTRLDRLGFDVPLEVGDDTGSTVTITGQAFVADTSITLTASMGGTSFRVSGGVYSEGTFTVEGNTISVDTTVLDARAPAFALIDADGTEISLPEGSAGMFDVPIDDEVFTDSTVVCGDTEVTFDVVGTPYGRITYTRAG
jgi:hypothetical protein